MTHISYLNDEAELTYAVDSMRQSLLAHQHNAAEDTVIQKLINQLGDLTPATHFIASFSASGDKLSQWRSYAGDGTGVAIGFDMPESLTSYDEPFVLNVGQVKYGTEGLDDEVAKLQRHFSQETHRWQGPVTDGERNSSYELTAQWLADEISKSSAFRKHHGFSEEEEWRLTLRYDFGTPRVDCGAESGEKIISKESKIARSVIEDLRSRFAKLILFRAGRCGLTPYIDFHFGIHKIGIKEVVLGPKTLDRVERPAFELLRQSRDLKFDIRRSEIPYR